MLEKKHEQNFFDCKKKEDVPDPERNNQHRQPKIKILLSPEEKVIVDLIVAAIIKKTFGL